MSHSLPTHKGIQIYAVKKVFWGAAAVSRAATWKQSLPHHNGWEKVKEISEKKNWILVSSPLGYSLYLMAQGEEGCETLWRLPSFADGKRIQ